MCILLTKDVLSLIHDTDFIKKTKPLFYANVVVNTYLNYINTYHSYTLDLGFIFTQSVV